MSVRTPAALLEQLYTALDRHDHSTMASCYHADATFRDIAFSLSTKKQIHAMWHMICDGDIRVCFEVVHADDQEGCVKILAVYTFGAGRSPPKVGRPVRNAIESRFRFQDGLIIDQRDECDARAWAKSALGGPIGFLAGHIRFLRSLKAQAKLKAFVLEHPQYQ